MSRFSFDLRSTYLLNSRIVAKLYVFDSCHQIMRWTSGRNWGQRMRIVTNETLLPPLYDSWVFQIRRLTERRLPKKQTILLVKMSTEERTIFSVHILSNWDFQAKTKSQTSIKKLGKYRTPKTLRISCEIYANAYYSWWVYQFRC